METLAPYLWWLGLFANEMIIEMDTLYTHTHTHRPLWPVSLMDICLLRYAVFSE